MDAEANSLRAGFIGWQCLLRRLAMRRAHGCPSRGLVPLLLGPEQQRLGHAIVLLTPLQLQHTTSEFRFIYQRTQDPQQRRERIVRVMAAGFFQQPDAFSDCLTTMVASASSLLSSVLAAGTVGLHFEQHDVAYRLSCRAKPLHRQHPLYQFSYWHNLNFNPHIPPHAAVIAFTPDWHNSRVVADTQRQSA